MIAGGKGRRVGLHLGGIGQHRPDKAVAGVVVTKGAGEIGGGAVGPQELGGSQNRVMVIVDVAMPEMTPRWRGGIGSDLGRPHC